MTASPPSRSASEAAAASGGVPGPGHIIARIGAVLAGSGSPRQFWAVWTVQTVVVVVINLLSVQARFRDAALSNLIEPVWRPFTDELSSGVIIILAYPLLYRMAVALPPGRVAIGRFLGLHAAAAAVFTALHLTGFVAIRFVIYGLFGELYRFGGMGQVLYELPRDLTTYGLTVGGVWGVGILLQGAQSTPQAARVTVDIRDNGRVVRAAIDDIVAVRSAGNYVEFLLADGRKPLMRATLVEMAQQLGPHGLIRTHRSWLVNKARISGVDPAGSGDFRITLAGGVQAPLSRRLRSTIEL